MSARDWSQPCYTADTRQSGKYGSFCQRGNIATLIADDFSETGKCNYYVIEERFLTSGSAMAFQVCTRVMRVFEHPCLEIKCTTS